MATRRRRRSTFTTQYEGLQAAAQQAAQPPPPIVGTTTLPDNPTLARQEPLKLTIPKGVAVVGCGGVGSWVAYLLALAGVTNLWLFDPDLVSEHNLNRLALLGTSNIGQSKSKAMADAIMATRLSCKPVALASFTIDLTNAVTLENEVNWVVCTTDTLASRRLVHKWAYDAGIHYIEAAAEGEFGSIAAAPAEWSTPDETRAGYASVPVWVGPCVNAAQMAVAHILHNAMPHRELCVRMGWSANIFQFMRTGGPAVTPIFIEDDLDEQAAAG